MERKRYQTHPASLAELDETEKRNPDKNMMLKRSEFRWITEREGYPSGAIGLGKSCLGHALAHRVPCL